MNIYKKIKELRLSKNWTQTELAQKVGYADKSAIAYIEQGKRDLPQSKVIAFAKAFDVAPSYLLEDDTPDIDDLTPITYHRIPKLGSAAAGIPCTVQYDGEDYVEVPDNIIADYCLDIHGSSMEPLIKDGDIVFIKYQNVVDNGDIAVVLIDGEATLKKFFKTDHQIQLLAINPNFPAIIINEDDPRDIRIVGKAISYNRKF